MSGYVDDLEDRLRSQQAEIERLREELRESDAEVVALALRNNTLRTKLDKALGWIERLIPYDDPDSWEGLAKLRGEKP